MLVVANKAHLRFCVFLLENQQFLVTVSLYQTGDDKLQSWSFQFVPSHLKSFCLGKSSHCWNILADIFSSELQRSLFLYAEVFGFFMVMLIFSNLSFSSLWELHDVDLGMKDNGTGWGTGDSVAVKLVSLCLCVKNLFPSSWLGPVVMISHLVVD